MVWKKSKEKQSETRYQHTNKCSVYAFNIWLVISPYARILEGLKKTFSLRLGIEWWRLSIWYPVGGIFLASHPTLLRESLSHREGATFVHLTCVRRPRLSHRKPLTCLRPQLLLARILLHLKKKGHPHLPQLETGILYPSWATKFTTKFHRFSRTRALTACDEGPWDFLRPCPRLVRASLPTPFLSRAGFSPSSHIFQLNSRLQHTEHTCENPAVFFVSCTSKRFAEMWYNAHISLSFFSFWKVYYFS